MRIVGSEIFFCPQGDTSTISLAPISDAMRAHELSCKADSDQYCEWIGSRGYVPVLHFSGDLQAITFITLDYSSEDPIELPDRIERAFSSLGWTADDGLEMWDDTIAP